MGAAILRTLFVIATRYAIFPPSGLVQDRHHPLPPAPHELQVNQVRPVRSGGLEHFFE
jgi:hypothetical protein